MKTERFAVVPTHDRPTEYRRLLKQLEAADVTVITVAHDCTYPDYIADGPIVSYRSREGMPPYGENFNISHAWNLGLNKAVSESTHLHGTIAVLNDDVTLPEGWWEAMELAILGNGFPGASGPRDGSPTKIAGYAFALDLQAVSEGLQADEQFVWWYGDDDLQRQCEELGGFMIDLRMNVDNKYANTTTVGWRRIQAAKDRAAYERKWSK